MIKSHVYDPSNHFHTKVFLFAFMPVIQLELNQSLKIWNSRNIRQSAQTPGGVPEILFYMPNTVGYELNGVNVDDNQIQTIENILGIQHAPMYKNIDLWELLNCYMQIYNLELPKDPESAIDLFVRLLEILRVEDFEV